tara:strand:+ start:8186 stop:9055 length:870 start_codon:yes stop_codon:yes gene_type:complete
MAEADVQIRLVDENDSLLAGVISIYDASLGLVHRSSSQGLSVFNLQDDIEYTVSVISSQIFNNVLLTPVDGATYELQAIEKTVPSPSRSDLCIIYGNVILTDGSPATNFYLETELMSGDIVADNDVIYLSRVQHHPTDKGYVQFELLRDREYRVSTSLFPSGGEVDVKFCAVPDRNALELSSFLYPKTQSIQFDIDPTGNGDFVFTIQLTDGQQLSNFSEIDSLLTVEVENAEAEITETSSGLSVLRIAGGGAGSIIRIYGSRTGIHKQSDQLSSVTTVRGELLRTLTL